MMGYRNRRRQGGPAFSGAPSLRKSVLGLALICHPSDAQIQNTDNNVNNYCGKDWLEAYNTCYLACPNGKDSECASLGEEYACQQFTLCNERLEGGDVLPTPIATTVAATDAPSRRPTESPVAAPVATTTAATSATSIAFPTCPDEYSTEGDYTFGSMVAYPVEPSSSKVYECQGEHCNAGPSHAPGTENGVTTWILRGTCDSSVSSSTVATVPATQGSVTIPAGPALKWFPDPNLGQCAYGIYYPPVWMTNDVLRETFLFESEEECCAAHATACPVAANATDTADLAGVPTQSPTRSTLAPTAEPSGSPTEEVTEYPTSFASTTFNCEQGLLFGVASIMMALLL